MQEDFHYYATYAAAYLAGYSHEEAMAICYSAQFVDLCTRTYLTALNAPPSAATTQLQLELADARTDLLGIQDMTRIWASFHFLPRDLYKERGGNCGKTFMNKYRLICGPNSDLVEETVRLAKDKNLPAVGIAMHVLADTWAHTYFAGTPSLVINNKNDYFYEILETEDGVKEVQVRFVHNPKDPDDLDKSTYTDTVAQGHENSVMYLGHGRAGHLPDYSFIRYRYMPSWGDYKEIVKDNPHDYMCAFRQMVYAMKYLRGEYDEFVRDTYDTESVDPYADEIDQILRKRQLNACHDWKAFGEKLSGKTIEDFDLDKYKSEYLDAENEIAKDDTFLGQFFIAAMSQKSMVTAKIYKSGNKLAGYSIDYVDENSIGIRDYIALIRHHNRKEADQ